MEIEDNVNMVVYTFMGFKEVSRDFALDYILWFVDSDGKMYYETLSNKRINELFGFYCFELEFFPDRWIGYQVVLVYDGDKLVSIRLFS